MVLQLGLYRIYPSLTNMDKLIPAIAQDWKTREVLMLAYMNGEALQKTRETGRAHYWSRSRGKLWLKGESSGHYQEVMEIRIDCDQDAILLLVKQEGGACHTGYRSCFYRTIDGQIVGDKVFEPEDVY
ncbi:MAG: phosphoribosyl-AMP cyclohydrolase [Methanotrichaceae archaeon]|nr:phosphoribosyl-AMP cyclohydrolase [Methanotrichaceae archaeon]